MNEGKKLIIGWFSFTCSEDSTILLTELLNDHLEEWKEKVEFRYFKALKTKNQLNNLDVAFIEGAISSDSQALEIKKIRDNTKYVVAIGSCACTGRPSSSRMDLLDNEKIKKYFERFDYSPAVKKLSDVIKVDDMVPGCPMNVPLFLQTLEKYLKLCTTQI